MFVFKAENRDTERLEADAIDLLGIMAACESGRPYVAGKHALAIAGRERSKGEWRGYRAVEHALYSQEHGETFTREELAHLLALCLVALGASSK